MNYFKEETKFYRSKEHISDSVGYDSGNFKWYLRSNTDYRAAPILNSSKRLTNKNEMPIMVKYCFYIENIWKEVPLLRKYSVYVENICTEVSLL